MTSIEGMIQTLKSSKRWQVTFDRATYWETQREELDYVDTPHPARLAMENWEVANSQFLYYWTQFGISWQEWTDLKARLLLKIRETERTRRNGTNAPSAKRN